MKMKFVTFLATLALLLGALTTPLMAFSFGVGASIGGSHVEITGTETLKGTGTKQSAEEDAQLPFGSAYAQVIVGDSYFGEGNGFALGYEHIFGQGSRDRTAKDVVDQHASETSTTGDQYAKVTFKNLNNIFIETPGFTPLGIYLKTGYAEMDIATHEELSTGGVWPDATADGVMYGFGFKKAGGGFQVKTEFNYTDWDQLTISSSSDTASTIDATPEQWSAKFSIGYNF